MMKKLQYLILFLVVLQSASAQDTHFSQSYSAPLTLNPAMTGLFEGGYRISAIYRDQWRNVLADPLSSFAGMGEVRFGKKAKRRTKTDFYGIGLQFGGDKVDQFDMNTTQLGLSAAMHKALDKNNRQYLSAGFRMGVVQRNLNYENLTFQDQFNGVNGFDLATQERLPANNFGYFDLGIGLHYSFSINEFVRIFAGGAYDHVTAPNISFFSANDSPITPYDDNPIDRKITGHFSIESAISEQLSFSPRVIYVNQGPHTLVQLGTNFSIHYGTQEDKSVNLGIWARGVQDDGQSPTLESIIAMVGLEVKGMQFGFSYENNINDITNEFVGQGAFEFSISYIGNYENVVNYCPDF